MMRDKTIGEKYGFTKGALGNIRNEAMLEQNMTILAQIQRIADYTDNINLNIPEYIKECTSCETCRHSHLTLGDHTCYTCINMFFEVKIHPNWKPKKE